jgi:hypothetical protein
MATSKTPAKRKKATKRKATPRKKTARKWSAKVTRTSDALDLESRIFRAKDPKKVARSLKRSSEKSKRRKGTPLQSAMSMLNFYINRAGHNLPAGQRKVLDKAKDELRELFGGPRQH